MFESSLKLLKKIENAGYEAYIVGGFSRDKYLGIESADVDVCTNATPKELKEIFKEGMLPKEEYGSINVIYNKIRFDITTYRKDIKYENNRLPVEIKYINDLKEDLLRRDFIINTLCIDSQGNYVDLLNAKFDIENKIIRVVGDADSKIEEDVLRILRAVRFATILNFELDNELKLAIKKHAHLLENLSYYRKKEELEKIFSSINSKRGIDLLLELELDKYLELGNLNKVVVTTSAIGIWAQLDLSDKYIFSNNEKDSINLIKKLINKNSFTVMELYNYGLYVPLIVAEINNIDKNALTKVYMNLPIISIKQIQIDGKEICELLNIKPSMKIKTILKDLESKILFEELENDKQKIKDYILRNYSNE